MTGIENRIAFEASPRVVFKHLANPQNIPLFVPGILTASVNKPTDDGIGTRVTLTTRHRHQFQAVIEEETARRFIAIQDDRGTRNEWELKDDANGGTLAVNRIMGAFPGGDDERLHDEAREKLFAFKEFVEAHANDAR